MYRSCHANYTISFVDNILVLSLVAAVVVVVVIVVAIVVKYKLTSYSY